MDANNISISTIDELAVRCCNSFDQNPNDFIRPDCKGCDKKGIDCGCNNSNSGNTTHPYENMEHQQHDSKEKSQTKNGMICGQCHNESESICDWLQCPECDGQTPEINGDSCFEYEGRNFCHYHYSLKTETHCVSCNMAILKEFVQHPNEPNQEKWHPTCYMIQKSWNVQLQEICFIDEDVLITIEPAALEQLQTATETKIERIWAGLSTYEESAATCISDMLLHFAAGSRIECLQMMSQFMYHVQVLFSALDLVVDVMIPDQVLGVPEVKSVCDQMMCLLHLLAGQPQHELAIVSSATDNHPADVARQVLELVTGVAQNLKALIRAALVQSLELEHTNHSESAIDTFLEGLLPLEKKRIWAAEKTLVAIDSCYGCKTSIEDGEYLKQDYLKWHYRCFMCADCHRALAETLGDARLIEYCSNNSLDGTPRFRKLACKDCYNINSNACKQKEQPHRFARACCFEQYLEPVRKTLMRYLDLHSGRISGVGEVGPLRTRSKRRTSSILRRLDRHPQREYFLEHGRSLKRSITLLDKSSLNRFGSIRRVLSKAEKRMSHPVPSQSTTARTTTATCAGSRILFMIDLISMEQETLARYLAALTLAIGPPCILTLDDVIALVDTDHQQAKRSLWSKIKKRIHTPHERQQQYHGKANTMAGLRGLPRMRIFGGPLTTTANVGLIAPITAAKVPSQMINRFLSETSPVPEFMKQCISTMLRCDMSVEGVFRKNGNIRDLNETCKAIDRDPGMCKSLLQGLSPIQLSALLKRYLHELPEPLLTYKLYDLWITASKLDSAARAKSALHLACCLLPKPNRDTFQVLCLLLKWVASYRASNKMDINNLARVIAPTILYTPVPPSRELVEKCTKDEIKVVELLILYQDDFLMIPPALTSLITDPRAAEIIASVSNTRQTVKSLHQYMLARTSSSV